MKQSDDDGDGVDDGNDDDDGNDCNDGNDGIHGDVAIVIDCDHKGLKLPKYSLDTSKQSLTQSRIGSCHDMWTSVSNSGL